MIKTNNETTEIFEIKSTQSNGLGAFATKKIKRGQLILTEEPIFIYPQNITQNHLETLLLPKLKTSQRNSFFQLNDCFNPQNPTPLGIVHTNGIQTDENLLNGAMYALIARLNHSCRPNVVYSWNERTKMGRLFALKEISPGEEICQSYSAELLASRDERRAYVLDRYKFVCECEVCSLSGEELRKSDIRRKLLPRIEQGIKAERCQEHPDEAVAKVEQYLKVLEEEKLGHLAMNVAKISSYAFLYLRFFGEKNRNDVEARAAAVKYWAKHVVENSVVAMGEFDVGDDAIKKICYDVYCQTI